MSNTPWTVQRNKRKPPATPSTVRKRARFSDDVVRRSSTPRSNSQKTLTQIAFIGPSPISHTDDTDLQEIPVSNKRRSVPSALKPRRLKKQDSTLTQMPWLGTSNQAEQTIDDSLLSYAFDETTKEPRISQHDGADDTSRQPALEPVLRDNKTPPRAPPVENGKGGSRTSKLTEKTRDTSSISNNISASVRRRSGRIASKTKVLPDKPDVSKTPNQVHYASVDGLPRSTTYHPAPLLEIQDSTEFDDHQIDTPHLNQAQQHNRPQTPNREYIASSQTPETIIRVTTHKRKRKDISPSKPTRTPLQERSINVPAIPQSEKRKTGHRTKYPDEPLGTHDKSSPPRKTCVLKVSRRALLPRARRVEDSQQDVYSLPATSSPRPGKDVQKPSSAGQSTAIQMGVKDVPDLPQTNDIQSSPPELDTQASLPQLDDLIPRRDTTSTNPRLVHNLKTKESHHQAAASDAVDTQDFFRDDPEPVADIGADEMLLDIEAGAKAKATSKYIEKPIVEVDESEVEFGSPILNDTQFNSDMKERTSSPTSTLEIDMPEERQRCSDTVDVPTPTQQRRTQVTFMEVPSEQSGTGAEVSMSTPRLVKRISQAMTQSGSNVKDSEEIGEPILPRLAHQSSTHVSTSRISLNDISSSSTSHAVPTQRMLTQKSIHPASMPRPSQMSTQEPTQSYFFSSIAPIVNQSHPADRISIKDSSSSDGHLNEIPVHIGQSQSQYRPLKLVIEDSEEEVDDLDLDPATGSKYSARKPISRQVTKTNSSMKSIHISASSSSKTGQDSSSSPAFQPRTENLLDSKRQQITSEEENTETRLNVEDGILDVLADIPTSSPVPAPSKRQRLPIPGFDNDTQSDFTQNGHVTAAYIHKQRDLGRYPEWFIPKPTSVGRRTKKKSTK